MLGRLLVFIAGLLVLTLFTALLAPYFVDWTNFKQDFEKQASLILGKKVVVHGDVSARLIPFPSVTMNDVRVAQAGEREPLVAVESFSMDMELAPFLSGEARIFEMRVEKPKVRLRLNETGTLDWVRSGNPSIPAKTVVLENIHVIDGELIFEDRQTGRTRIVDNLDMRASAKSLRGPWRFEGEGALDGVRGAFSASTGTYAGDGQLRVISHIAPEGAPLNLDLEGNLKMEELRLRYRGDFSAQYRSASGNADESLRGPRATGRFELANDAVRLPEYRLELGDPADPYIVNGEAALDTGLKPEFLLTADGQQVDISRIGGETAKTGRHADGNGLTRMRALMAIISDIPIPTVPGKATISLPSIVAGDTTYRNIVIEAEPASDGWSIATATAELPGRTVLEANGDLRLKGKRGFEGQLVVASNQPSGLAAWLSGEVDPAIRRLDQAGFSASVSLEEGLQRFEGLELAMGGEILRGRAERQAPENGKPSISVNLAGGALDIDAFRALSSVIFGGDGSNAVLQHSLAAKLDIKALRAFNTVANDVSGVLTFDDGVLNVDRFKVGDVAGVEVSGSGRFEGTLLEPRFKLNGRVQSEDPFAFFSYLNDQLPKHPALARLRDNSAYFNNSDFQFSVASGEDGDWPVQVGLDGVANGTSMTARLASEVFGFASRGGFSLDISAENEQTTTLMGQVGLQPLPIEMGAGGSVSIAMSRESDDLAGVSFTFTADDALLAVAGEADLGAEHFLDGHYSVTLESDDLETYLLMNGTAIPQMGAGLPIKLDAGIAVTPAAIAFDDLSAVVDRNAISGNLSLGRAATPKLSGSVTMDTLDIGWLAEAVIGPVTDAFGGWVEQPLAEPSDATFTAGVDVAAGRLWVGHGLPVENFSGTLAYDGRSVGLQAGKGRFAGGSAEGSISVANADGQAFVRTQFDVRDADFGRLSWQRNDQPVVSGKVRFSALLEAAGRSMAEVASQFNGSGVATLSQPVVDGLNLSLLPEIMDAADTIENLDLNEGTVAPLAEEIVGGGRTALPEVQVPFSVAGSVMRLGNVNAETDAASLDLDAEADIAATTIDAALRIAFKPGAAALAGAEPSVTVGFSGALSAPEISLDVSELAGFLSLRAFERERRRVELLQASILEKQRLRREAGYFKALEDAREKARLKAEEEARARQEADDEAARAAREAAEQLKAIQQSLEAQGAATPATKPRVAPQVERETLPASGSTSDGTINWNSLPAPANTSDQ